MRTSAGGLLFNRRKWSTFGPALTPVTRTAPEHRREQLGLVGFERGLPESNGDSIVQFIEAAESGDDSERDQLIAEVLKYNEEDLEATWAVFEWLRELARH